MRPGKRFGSNSHGRAAAFAAGAPPSTGSGGAGGGGGGGGGFDVARPRTWDLRLSTQLQRCILTHDLTHVLSWHTPAYTAFVWASLVATLLGVSTFATFVTYAASLAAAAIIVGGVAVLFDVESGPNAVVRPSESRPRSRPVLEANARGLFARWGEPLLAAPATVQHALGLSLPATLLVCFAVVSVAAESAKYFSGCVVVAVVLSALFASTGARALFLRVTGRPTWTPPPSVAGGAR
jgi:hypothetical protein